MESGSTISQKSYGAFLKPTSEKFTDSPDAVPFDYDALEQIMVNAAVGFQTAHPEIGAIVLECTNMPPFAKAIEMATHLPVYSIVSLANYVMSGVS